MFSPAIATVLEGVEWSFARNRYKDVPSFVKGVGLFDPRNAAWQSDRVVVTATAIRIRLAPQLAPAAYAGRVEPVERTGDGAKIATLRSAKGFTAGQLLFEAHNALRDGLKDAPDQLLHTIVQTSHAGLGEPALFEVRTKYWRGTEQPFGELPSEVLKSVPWNFRNCGPVKERDAFVERVATYWRELVEVGAPEREPFDADALVIPAPRIWVSYMVNHKDRLLLLESPEGFTAGQLLHAIHNDAAPRMGRTDHVFFEGLTAAPRFPTLPPGYWMHLGS